VLQVIAGIVWRSECGMMLSRLLVSSLIVLTYQFSVESTDDDPPSTDSCFCQVCRNWREVVFM